MTWRERLQPASFKGVPFFVDGEQLAFGRRVPMRRLSGRDGSVQQDNGEEADQFSVEAFLVGDDFDLERQDLENVLRQEGPGALVLPSRGDLWVRILPGCVSSQQRRRLGIVSIRFTCVVEERTTRAIQPSTDTAGKLKLAAADLRDAAETDFLDVFDVAGLPGKYVTKAVTAVQTVSSTLQRVMGKINGTLNPLQDFSAAIDVLGSSAADIISSPAQLAASVSGVVTSVFGLINTTSAALDRTTGLKLTSDTPYDASLPARTNTQTAQDMNDLGGDESEDGITASATQSAQNVRAVYRLARAVALAAQAGTYADVPLDSSTLALEIVEALNDEFDALQLYSATDGLFDALADARAAAVDHLTQTASKLPKAIALTPKQEVPALLLAHTLYGDARFESEIVARNLPRYPLFLSDPLEVLESLT